MASISRQSVERAMKPGIQKAIERMLNESAIPSAMATRVGDELSEAIALGIVYAIEHAD